jgi:hypothetical protein
LLYFCFSAGRGDDVINRAGAPFGAVYEQFTFRNWVALRSEKTRESRPNRGVLGFRVHFVVPF